MKDEHFEELLESVRQGGAILRGELEPSRVFVVKEEKPDYEDLWYTLYDYVLATGNRHIKRIMEEADPLLVEEEPGVFMPDREPQQ
jgi:hypothetical protein